MANAPLGGTPSSGSGNRGGDGAPAAKEQETGPSWAKVVKGGQVARSGGVYNLPTGEVINLASYDFEKLKNSGIVLEPCEAPEWHKAAQGTVKPARRAS